MIDTRRRLSDLQTILADNTTGDISAQDMRDFLISVYPDVENVKNHPSIQSAVNAAQSRTGANSSTAPIVFFPPGEYFLDETLIWGSTPLVGTYRTNILWNGPAGGTMIRKDPAPHPGGNSIGFMYGLSLRNGSSEPGTHIDFVGGFGNQIDDYMLLDRVHCKGCTDSAIKIESWTNLHWTHLRFDNIGGYCINAILDPSSQNLSSFVLDHFTMDHSRTLFKGKGFIFIDSTNSNTNLGTLEVKNGRIELNQPWDNPQALLHMKQSASPASRNIGAKFQNVTFQGNNNGSQVIIHRESTNTTGVCSLILDNVRVQKLAAVLSGTWPSNTPDPGLPSGGIFSRLDMANREQWIYGNNFRLIPRISDISHAVAITGHLSNTATIIYSPTLAPNTTEAQNITVTGASIGDTVYVVPNGDPGTGLTWAARVSAANTVEIRLSNPTTLSVGTKNKSWRADVWKHAPVAAGSFGLSFDESF